MWALYLTWGTAPDWGVLRVMGGVSVDYLEPRLTLSKSECQWMVPGTFDADGNSLWIEDAGAWRDELTDEELREIG